MIIMVKQRSFRCSAKINDMLYLDVMENKVKSFVATTLDEGPRTFFVMCHLLKI